MKVRLASSHADLVRCRYLIAETYNTHYNIVFSNEVIDLQAKIEPYPHRFLMGWVGEELVGAVGLYVRNTYVERFGGVTPEDIRAELERAGISEQYPELLIREPSKLVVRPGWERRGLGQFMFELSHSREFLRVETDIPALVVTCATRRVFASLHDRGGVRTRLLKRFPSYRVHELYRSTDNPMESRLIIPELDIPKATWERGVPGEYEVGALREQSGV